MEIRAWILSAFVNSRFSSQKEAGSAIGKSQAFISQALRGVSPKLENAMFAYDKANILPSEFVNQIIMNDAAKELKIQGLQEKLLQRDERLRDKDALIKQLQQENISLLRQIGGRGVRKKSRQQ